MIYEQRNYRYAFWAVLAATAAVRIGFGAVMPGLPLYVQEHGMGTGMISIMTNAYMVSNALFQGYAGHLGDRYGRRLVMLAGTWLYTAAAALFLFDGGPWFYVVLRALEGLGAAAFGPAARAFVADLVPEGERGKAYGQLMSFDMAGILLGPLCAGLVQGFGGLKATFAFCAILGLLAGIPLLLLTRSQPVGTTTAETAKTANIPTQRLLKSPAFWAVAMPGIGFAYLNGLYNVIWSLYMQAHGATIQHINLSFTLFAVPMVLLMVPFGALADRVGRPLVIAIGGIGAATATLGYGLFPAPLALISLCMLDGVSSALFSPASQAFFAEVSPPGIRGKFMGMVGSASTVATIAAVFLVGYLYEHASAIWLFGLGSISLILGCGSAVIIMLRRTASELRQSLEQLGD
ncbi:MAG TPA: MFS transporter [Symbiobacteriaceae bacterium]|nr:MFS transporter [Symbiobacteriaceae bacterium]